jgi:NADPH:quinone reductase-like Zn-dependent oxidoreductase
VVATTSSPEKAEVLKNLGAHHVLNYNSDPDWGVAARKLTPDAIGFEHVIDVVGPRTMSQSLKAVAIGGVLSVIGGVGGGFGDASIQQPLMVEALLNFCTVRGVAVGSRVQFEEMTRAIEANGIKPVFDKKVFRLDEYEKALQYLAQGKHVGKVLIQISN